MVRLFCTLLAVLDLTACGGGTLPTAVDTPPPQETSTEQDTPVSPPSTETEDGQEETALIITVGEQQLYATFADNSSAEEFQQLLTQGPLTIQMEDYGGFEKSRGRLARH